MVQWLKLHLPAQEVWVPSLIGELRSYMLGGQKNQNGKQKQYCNKFSYCCSVAKSNLALCDPLNCGTQAPLSFTISQSVLRFMSLESVMPSNYLIHVIPFSSHLQSFPASGSFPMSQCFTSDGQSIGVPASASVFPMNIQD